jgi:YD repeat-containing protein
LTLGQAVSGTLQYPGDEATYTFTGSPGQVLGFEGISVAAGITIYLVAPDGSSVLQDYVQSGSFANVSIATLDLAGTYTLRVQSSSSVSVGAYDFIEADLSAAPAIALTAGSGTAESNQTLASGTATNVYRIDGAAGQRLYFQALTQSAGPSDLAWELIGPGGNAIAGTYYYGSLGSWSGFGATLSADGTYYLAVTGTNATNASVTYNFEVYADVDPTAPLTFGQEISGTIQDPGDEASYTFTGSVGQALFFQGQDATSNGLSVSLTAQNGVSVQSLSTYIFTYGTTFALPFSGTYTLTVSGNGGTGSYHFTVDDLSASTAIALTADAVTTESNQTLASGTATNFYRIDGTAGQRLYFQALTQSGAPADLYWALYGPSGYPLFNSHFSSPSSWFDFTETLPADGTYYLTVTGTNAQNTKVTYSFDVYDTANTTSALTMGQPVSGTLKLPYDEATYTFTGSVGQRILVQNLGSDLYESATLVDPQGQYVSYDSYFYSSSNYSEVYTLLESGPYKLVVSRSSGGTGDYVFVVEDLAAVPKLQVNTTEADLTVTLSAASTQQVLVQYGTADGTAKAPGDYKAASGLLLFEPGQTTATVAVQAIDKSLSGASSFDVVLSNPVGATIAAGGGTGVVTLNPNAQGLLAGTVYDDLNGDGVLGAGDPGLAGWTVDLLDASNHVVATVKTDANGDYALTQVPPGSYTIAVVPQTGYVETEPASPGTYAVTVTAGQSVNDLNFGEFKTITLSGEVFDDINGDGSLDGGDPGLAGWTVDLLDASNHVIATAKTDANGDYAFPAVGPGHDSIQIVPQSGYVVTTASSLAPALVSGQDVANQDFGEFRTVGISGEVFVDANGDGALETGEVGLVGWTVDLENSAGTVLATRTTDSKGDYSFSSVGPGTFTVKVVQQTGYVASLSNPRVVSTSSGGDITGLNLGEFVPVAIGGEVYADTNGNGQLESGEAGLSNWTVDLIDGSGQTVATTTTDSNGRYSFVGVGAGTNLVQAVAPSGYVATTPPRYVTEASGQDIANLDIGEFRTVTLGGEVFADANGDGLLDGNESGLSGWTVHLLDSSNNQVAAASTASDGTYSFPGVGPGSYTVAAVLQAGYFQTSSPATYAVTTASGQDVGGLVFGVAQGATAAGELYEDANQNGSLDGGESGLSGWTIDLLDGSNKVVATAVTDAKGDYSFGGIAPGSYTIREVLQAGYMATSPDSKGVAIKVTSGSRITDEDLGVFKAVALAVTGLTTAPSSGLQSGTSLVVQWSDANTGTQPAAGSFDDQVTITNTTTGQVLATATVAYDATSLGNLAAGASAPRQYAFRLPDGAPGVGQIQFAVTADVHDDVSTPQGDPADTATITRASTLAPYPDLVVTNLALIPGSGLESGDHVTLSWDDANTGTGPTTSSWYDLVTITNTTTGKFIDSSLVSYDATAAGNGAIAAGDSRARQVALTLPDGSSGVGTIRFSVTTDFYNQIYEYNTAGPGGTSTAESNNTASLTADSTLAAYPDLSVTGLAVSPSSGLQSGESVTVRWSDANSGNASVGAAFVDHVDITNLTTGLTIGTQDLAYDPTAAGNGPIGAGQSLPRQVAFTLPRGTPGAGKIQFTVTTDYYNQIFEWNQAGAGGSSTAEANNVANTSVMVALAPYADLAASAVTAPSLTVGDPARVTVGWTVTNQGTGATEVPDWTDVVILSRSDDPTQGTVLARFPHQGTLAVGAAYSQSQALILPPHFQGRYHLFVRTNADGTVFENGNTANDYAEAPNVFDVTPIPYADLVVSSVTAPAAGASGRPIQVSWTVANQGIGVTNPGIWSDDVSLATDAAGTKIVADLGGFTHIGALAPGGSYTHTVDATLPDGLQGSFYVVVHTGGPYEFIYTNNNTNVAGPLTVTLTPPPDLSPTKIVAPTTAQAGDQVDVSWTVQNIGPGDANTPWIDTLYLTQVGGGTSSLGDFSYTLPLQSGKSYTRDELIQLPSGVQGVFQFSVTTAQGLFQNGATANDSFADPNLLTLTLPAQPNLQVASVTAPAKATAGRTVAVHFTVINQGTVPTTEPHWTDSVYLSLKDTLDSTASLLGSFPNQSALGPGESYQTHTGDMIVPIRFGGAGFIIVKADSGGTFTTPIDVTPYPPADLVTGGVTAPDQTYDGTSITVSYTVTNKGLAATDIGNWTDTIWLAHDPKRPGTTKGDVVLATLSHSGVLGNDPSVLTPPTSYTVTTTVTLPKHISGQFYITAWADTFDLVLKSTLDVNINPDDPNELNNDNWKARPITVLLTPPPDLVVTSVVPQATAVGGDAFTVAWTVQNQGTSPTEDATLFDDVYLSDQPTLNAPGADQWFLGKVEHDGIVASGASYNAQATFQLSPEISGKYVIVNTNTGDIDHAPTWEGPYTNDNTNDGPTLVTPLPPADLQVTSIVTQSPNDSGEKTTVQWTVTNFGNTTWAGTQYWVDQVYFSPYPTLDGNATLVGQVAHSNDQTLANGQSYSSSLTFALPRGIGGTDAAPQTFYVYVITDHYGSTSTGGRDNSGSRNYYTTNGYEDPTNNQGQQTLPVIYREPDLRVTNLVVPSTAPHSGDIIPVSWTVTNVGNRDTREGYWYDRVFLSRSPSLDDQSYMLGQVAHSSILPTGQSYDASINVQLPDGIQGNFYILVFTDANVTGDPTIPGIGFDDSDQVLGRVGEYQGEGNNITAAPLSVILTIPPDLQVSSVTAVGPDPSRPDHVQTGQDYTITYTVTDAGAGDTPPRQGTWEDWIFLSRDPILDNGDIYLGQETHSGGLKAGQSYTVTESFKATRNLSGPWYAIVITDPPSASKPRGQVYEGANEANNTTVTTTPLVFDIPPPSDLTVQTITVPGTAQSGQPVEIQWTVQNIGAFAASGSWTDSVYLSTDATWDINDLLIGQVAFAGTVAPGGSYTSKLDALLPAAAAGEYRVIVRTDIFDEVVESNELNNTTASADAMNVTVPELHLGVPVQTTLSTGQQRLYEVKVGLGQTLRVDLTSSDPAASNVLFLRYNAVPTGSQYDAAYQGALQANQFAVIPSTQEGEYLILIGGQSEASANTPVTLVANVLPFEITDVQPDNGGDSKYVTTKILGAQFDPQAIIKLVRPGMAEYEPVSYQVVDSTQIVAIFDLTNAPHGLYDVEVINPDGQVAVAPYRYLVEQALPPDVSVALGGPRVLTAGQGALYGFSLESLTNVDIPYVDFQVGIPELDGIAGPYPQTDQYRHLALTTNMQSGTNPDVADVPWASLDPVVDTNGEDLATAYAVDFADRSNLGETLFVQTYPDGVPPSAGQNPPSDTAFQFHIMAAATPLTTAEFIAQQTQEAAALRAAILADPTASSSLQVLASNATSWTDLYLTALTQAGVLRPEDVPPAVHLDPDVQTLTATLAAGILAGPAGQTIITGGNLPAFFDQVIRWYGADPTQKSPYIGSRYVNNNPEEPGSIVVGNPPPASAFDLQQSSRTHFEAFNVYVNYTNDYDDDEIADSSHPEDPNFVPVQPPNFSPFFTGASTAGQAQMVGPYGYGSEDYVPVDQPLPYTILFTNPSSTSTVGQIRIVSQLDPNVDPRSFRLGDLQIGDLQVHIPNTVGSFQGDFDFTRSKGFILRVSAGIDIHSGTITWLLQAIDPTTGEVEQGPTRGLLAPGSTASGFATYTVQPLSGLATGTQISAQARVLFDTSAPQDTNTVTSTVDTTAPSTTLTATPIAPGSPDYQVQWTAVDDNGGSGVKGVTVYVSEDGGDWQIWLDQTTATSGIYNGQAGHTYQFLALATDNAGNHEAPPSGTSVPGDDSQVNLGALPTVSSTSTDLGPPAQPSTQPSTNPLFIQAQQAIPAPTPATRTSEFSTVVQPFTGRAYATGFVSSGAGIGPVAIVVFPDGSALVSGGPDRNQLFAFTAEGGEADTPLATEPFPIYDMALDASGHLWATTGGGPLLQLDPQTGAVLGTYGDSLTQSLAIQPGTGLIYVSSGGGIEVFNPTTQAFTHFSDLRVGSLASAPDGTLWAATWPHNSSDIIDFVQDSPGPNPITPHYHAQLMLQLDSPVDSIAFGLPNTSLAGLLFISHDEEARAGQGTELTMVDLATLHTVAIATGGTRGDELKATPRGQILISQSDQVDILSPVQAPRVAGSNPPDGATVGLPLGTITVIFDHDMFQGDPTDPRSVLDPANYQLVGDTAGPIAINSVAYDPTGRIAVLSFDAIEPGGYTLSVGTAIQSTDGLALADPYSAHFTAIEDLSTQVSIHFFNGRANAANQTYSYSVTVTNNGPTPLLAPIELTFDSLQPVNGRLMSASKVTADGTAWLDLSADVTGGELFPGQTTIVATVTFSDPSGLKLAFKSGLLAMPAPNADPVFDATPVTTATAGQPYRFQATAHDPNRYALSYLLVRGAAGMKVDSGTGLVRWLPTVASPSQAPVVLQVYDTHGSHATLSFTIDVAGVDLPPVIPPLPAQETGQEGQTVQIALGTTDPQNLPLISWADNLPPGAVYDSASETLTWVPADGQAGTYPEVQFFVSDGVKQVSTATTLLIAPDAHSPTLVRPADRTVLEGESIHIPLQGTDPDGSPLTYSSAMLPGGAYLDPNSGVFDWTPGYDQHGTYQIPFTVSNVQMSVTQTTTFTVLNVNAPPQFDYLGAWRVYEGQHLSFRAFAFDPNNPGFVPQDRTSDGTLTPLEGTLPTITYTVSGLPSGATFDPTTAMFDWPVGYTDAGHYVVTFTATNDGDGTGVPLSSTVSVPITIVNTNRAPQLTFVSNQTVDAGSVLTLPIQATDPDGDPMVLTAGGTTDLGLPSFATFKDNGNGTGTFTFAPGPDVAGNFTITLNVHDDGDGGGPAAVLSDSESFVVTVNNPNRPPHLAPIGDKVGVVGQPLTFTIHATDGDQDPLTFGDLGLPLGATLTPSSTYGDAVVTWTPGAGDLGQSTVVFTVADNGNGNPADVLSDRRSIHIVVRQTDRAPVLVPVADQTIDQQQALVLQVQATDPDDDPLIFSAANLPTGASFDPVKGVLTWTPNLFQSGTFGSIVLGASDGYLTTTETLTIHVTAINQPPKLVPLVEQDGREGAPMQFTLAAADPDGDSLTYSAISGMPAHATFNTITGQFQWTPSYDQAGDYTIRFGVSDPGGLSDQIDVKVHIDNVDRPPTLVVTNHQAVVGQPLKFTLQGSDPDQGTVLTYSATGLPEGATLNPSTGAVSWMPGPAQVGDYVVQFTVSDGQLTATEPSVLRGEINPVPPQVIIVLTPSFPAKPGQSVLVHVAASSLAPITGLMLTIGGQPVALDSQGRATYTPTSPGRIAIAATATDGDGFVGQAAAVLKVLDPNDQVAPGLAFSPQLANARLTTASAVVGTVSSTNLDSWVLDFAPVGSSTFTALAQGNAPITGNLATFDPTTVSNGPYVLRLTATDIAGRTSQTTLIVEADTAARPTQYLRSETDLSVTLAGSVFNLVRTYDSLDAGQSGTFGYGWRLASQDTDIQTTVLPTGHESTGIFNPFRVGSRVYLTLPTGQRVGFTFTPTKQTINGLTYFVPAYTADSGVTYTLASAGGPLIQAGDRFYDLKTGLAYNPAADLYAGPEYTLTAPDGTAYDLSTARGVQEIIRPDGTSLYLGDSGITTSTGESLQFVRDCHGRITSITAPDGTRVVYTYDDAGNLIGARNLVAGQSSRYGYQSGPGHLLTEAVSPASGTSAAIRYTPSLLVSPLTADLGSTGQFLSSDRTGTLSAGGTDRYTLGLRSSELASTTSGEVYLGISVQATAGSALQPAVPALAGLTPLVSRTTAHGAFALYAITQSGLELLQLSGANGTTAGDYTVHLFVAGDVNGDGTVDGQDGQLLAAALGTSIGQPGYLASADANQDGVINATDDQLLSADLGFLASPPPVATSGQFLTHQGLAVTVDLSTLATDPLGDPLYFRVLNPQNASVTLGPDGHTVTFVPAPGYTGPAGFQFQADDGYGSSPITRVAVDVSAAPLVDLDISPRAAQAQPGDVLVVSVTGDFADQQGVALPTSYVTLSSSDLSTATISADGHVRALANGTTAIIATRGDIQAATVLDVQALLVDDSGGIEIPDDLNNPPLDVYPATLSLPSGVGTRQLTVTAEDGTDMTSTSSGTLYFVSNPQIVQVTNTGMVLAGQAGSAKITVISQGKEAVIPVRVEAPAIGPAVIGPEGGIIESPDGIILQVPPDALAGPESIAVASLQQSQLLFAPPAGFHYGAAFQLTAPAGTTFSQRMQLAMPVNGAPAGATALFFRADTYTDENGNKQPIWVEVEDGVVGADGVARTSSPPFKGLDTVGEYIVTWLDSNGWGGAVYDTARLAIPAFIGAAAYLVGGLGAGIAFGAIAAIGLPLVLALPLGNYNLKMLAVPDAGATPVAQTLNVDIGQGFRQFSASFAGLLPQAQPPVIQTARVEYKNGKATIVLDGAHLPPVGQAIVTYQTTKIVTQNGVPTTVVTGTENATIESSTDTELRVDPPQTLALGLANIFITVAGAPPNSNGPRSNVFQITPDTQYAFVAMPGAGKVAVLDADQTSSTFNDLLSEVDLGGHFPSYVATTGDHTRAYVTLGSSQSVAVIDAATFQELDTDPNTPGVQPIPLRNASGASPFEIVIDHSDHYAYISDQAKYTDGKGRVYVIDIDPRSSFYNKNVGTIVVDDAPDGLRGLAISGDGESLYVAAPNSRIAGLHVPQDLPVSHLLVVDLNPSDADYWAKTYKNSGEIATNQATFGVTAGPADDAITFANYLADATGFGLTLDQGLPQMIPVDLPGSGPDSSFDVNNIREIAITPDAKYAFVTGWDIPSQDIPSHDHFEPPSNPAGSTIGIIADPLGSPRLVAATRAIPAGFPQDLALTPDGQYLYATYGAVPVQGAGGGAVFVYGVAAMIKQVEDPNNAPLLQRYGVDDVVDGTKEPNAAIDIKADYRLDNSNPSNPTFKVFDSARSPIGLGGATRGVAVQGAILTASGQLGDVNEVDLQQLIKAQFGYDQASDFYLSIADFRGGRVVLTPRNGLTPANATQGDILWKDQASGEFYVVADLDQTVLQAAAASPPSVVWGYIRFTLPNGTVQNAALRLNLDSGDTPFTLAGSVGEGGTSSRGLDVYRVEQRLAYLGFPNRQGVALSVDGLNGPSLDQAIRLFQAVVDPTQTGPDAGNPLTTSDGLVGFGNDDTLAWLNAINAPHWEKLLDPGLNDGYVLAPANILHNERYGSSWTIQTIIAATAATAGFNEMVTSVSDNGYTAHHSEHKSGMDIDINLPAGARRAGNATEQQILNDAYPGQPHPIVTGALNADEQAVVNSMVSFYRNVSAKAQVVRIIVTYQRLADAFNQATGTTLAVSDEESAHPIHYNHFHVDLAPPPRQDPQAQLALGGAAIPAGPLVTASVETLQDLSEQAVALWRSAGLDPAMLAALSNVTYRIEDLPGALLGQTSPGVITIDGDAAGHGWFIDPTPGDNSEFGIAITPSEFDATPGSPAAGKYDLLTVVAHELGHVLGLPDLDVDGRPYDLMDGLLAPGVRRMPSSYDIAAVGSATPWSPVSGISDAARPYSADISGSHLVSPTGPATPVITSISPGLAKVGSPDSRVEPSSFLWSVPPTASSAPQVGTLASSQSTSERTKSVEMPTQAAALTTFLLGSELNSTGISTSSFATVTTIAAPASIDAFGVPSSAIGAVPPAQSSDWPRPVPLFDRIIWRMSAALRGRQDDPAQQAPARSPSPEAGGLPSDPIIVEGPKSSRPPVPRDGRRDPDIPEWLLSALFEATAVDRSDRFAGFDDIAREVLTSRHTESPGAPESPVTSRPDREDKASRSDHGSLFSSAVFWLGGGLMALVRSLRPAGARLSRWIGADDDNDTRQPPQH